MPRVEAARVLRDARDLMNTNGRHWVQGDLQVFVDEETLEASRDGTTSVILSPKAQLGDTAFCVWGGIREIADDLTLQVEAMEALVQIINLSEFNAYLAFKEETTDEYENERDYSLHSDKEWAKTYPTFLHFWDTQLERREECLGDIIANWNDDDKRTWEDVRTSLTKAAANLKRSKFEYTDCL